jgi:two-component system, response regulator
MNTVMKRNQVILLVEDKQYDQKLAQSAFRLSNVDAELVVVNDGMEALDYLFATGQYSGMHPPLPKVVLLDLKMPRLDGLQVLRRMREDDRTKKVPVVILTTSNQEQDVQEAYALGVNSYIRKPIDFDEFISVITNIAEYWLQLNRQ